MQGSCLHPAGGTAAVSLQNTLLQAQESSSRGDPSQQGCSFPSKAAVWEAVLQQSTPRGQDLAGRRDGTLLRGSQRVHRPTASSPLMHDGVPASEDVSENISSTDTNCYSSHPRVSSSPAQLPSNITQPLHFSTN